MEVWSFEARTRTRINARKGGSVQPGRLVLIQKIPETKSLKNALVEAVSADRKKVSVVDISGSGQFEGVVHVFASGNIKQEVLEDPKYSEVRGEIREMTTPIEDFALGRIEDLTTDGIEGSYARSVGDGSLEMTNKIDGGTF